MKSLRFGRAAAVLSIGALAFTLSACGSDENTGTGSGSTTPAGDNNGSSVTGTLTGIGASTQASAMEAWKTGFASANSGAQVQYSPDGSGAGRKAFLSGAAQFAGSDAFLKEEELASSKEQCGPDGGFDVPAYISPIAIAYNLPGVEGLKLDAATIAKIFRGEITNWNDPAIAALNEGTTLPDTKITPVHRSDESGTTENFTDYLSAVAPEVWTDEKSQTWPSSLQGEAAAKTSGVVSAVTGTEGAITYADESAVGDLGTAQLKVGEEFVPISPEAAAKAIEVSEQVTEGRPANDIAIKLDRKTTEPGTYPLVLVSYQIFCSAYKDQNTVDLVKAWGNYVTSAEGQQAAQAAAGNAPLSDALSQKVKASIDSITVAK
ncbi:phosphate ABC transporter substrate-binding protein PstS [Haematomicrobium sanguinis]|uniref:phosphate ABC transporter substrate-binding protein PstS n=1 Tax=Haematomicrobium sanguinis TaxID=479106 RepID=UPI00047CB46E|nr:phosphate ABC transporter substrate-binding protein PstS [Haematomicrobium sanguinis]